MKKEPIKLDLDKIVGDSLKKSGLMGSSERASTKERVDESYVAEPKKFPQVTEFLTQKTKDAHIELYKGYIESLNKVSAELDTADMNEANSRHSEWRSLKLDETFNRNAVWLHELFFSNSFDPHSEVMMDSMAFLRLERDFGGFDRWQKCFIACAMSAGEGWVVTGYDMFLKQYTTTVISHHSGDVPVGFYPIVVLDCWYHAYGRDYLNDRKNYIVAMMRELSWVVINERVEKAERIAEALK
jgi:Fe-Mn family superoxide dismutase